MFKPKVFRKQMKKKLATLLGLFSDPQSFGAPLVIRRPGNYTPLAPSRYAPACAVHLLTFMV